MTTTRFKGKLLFGNKKTYKSYEKNTKPVKWSTQGGDFQTNHTANVELILPELYAKKSVTFNFNVDDLH